MGKKKLEEKIKDASSILNKCRLEIGRRVVGQRNMIDGMLMGLLAGGHVLIEGVPGLAKTLAVRTLAEVIDVDFKRIQFTPDLLPADLIGTMIYRQPTGEFIPRKGPIFSNIVLADEINRAPAKVQSALLEAMEERQVTIGNETFKLDSPFFVLATQNPIEHEGTYPLPEAQLDRFLLKLRVEYPGFDEELDILRLVGKDREIAVSRVMNKGDIESLKNLVSEIKIEPSINEYIVSVVSATRGIGVKKADFVRYIEFGASPRASIYLHRCSKIKALFDGRGFVIPEDVKAIAHNILRHRIVLNYEAESDGVTTENIISSILNYVQVP